MAVSVTCPGCRTSYPVTDDLLGKKIRCKKCQETFTAAATRNGTPKPADDRIQTKPGAAKAVARPNGTAPAAARPTRPTGASGKTLIGIAAAAGGLVAAMAGVTWWALTRNSDKDNGVASATGGVTPPPPRIDTAPPVTAPPVSPTGTEATSSGKATKPESEPAQQSNEEPFHSPRRGPRPADFRPGIATRVSKSAVLIRCTTELGLAYGSGWVAEKNGNERFIITNSHVVNMKEPANPPPEKLEIVFDAGPDECAFEGKLLAIDRDEDLAVIRVKGPNLPEPLAVVPSTELDMGQRMMIVGFPLGGMLGTAVRGTDGEATKVTVKTRPSTVAGRVLNADGSVKYIQAEGGADPGNSGGAVIDTNGDVVAVLVAGIPSTNMRFVIPSEYVMHLLNGRVQRVTPGQAVTTAGGIKQTLTAQFADPMHRVRKVAAEVWAGKAGKLRPAADSQPEPQPGDGQRAIADLPHDPNRPPPLGESYSATCELNLPTLHDGEVYWFQPHYTATNGKERWGEAIPIEMGRYPVEAKPATIELKLKADPAQGGRALVVRNRTTLRTTLEELGNTGSEDDITSRLTERVVDVTPNGDAKVKLQYSTLQIGDPDSDTALRKRLRGVLESVDKMWTDVTVTRDGRYRTPRAVLAEVPESAKPILRSLNQEVIQSLESLNLQLPNRSLKPGDTWPAQWNNTVVIEDITRSISAALTCRYIGTRTRDGREEAVIEVSGTLQQAGRGRGANPGEGGGGASRAGFSAYQRRGRGGGGGQPPPPPPNGPGGQPPAPGGPGGPPPTPGGTGGQPPAGGDDAANRNQFRGAVVGAALLDLATGQITLSRIVSDVSAEFPINVRNGITGRVTSIKAFVGIHQELELRRSLTKVAPKDSKALSIERVLPNQAITYNPLVGVGVPVAESTPPSTAPDYGTSVALPREALERVQKAAVYLLVTKFDGEGDQGSGWFAEPGVVITNCHVVGMLSKSDRKPEKIEVVIDKGLPTERKLPGEVIMVDRQIDLAAVRVRGDGLPEPLKTEPAADLAALPLASALTVVGFPEGENLTHRLEVGLGNRSLKTTLKARSTTATGRVLNADGSVKYVQLEGGADPGNSGGAVVDSTGAVRAVLVSGIPGTQLVFAIPSDHVVRLLQGYPLEVEPGRAYLDGAVAKQPVEITVSDPMKRIAKMAVDVWVGPDNNGKPRQPTATGTKPADGDSPRQTFDLTYDAAKQTARGEFPFPEVGSGRVVWLQPRFVNGAGQDQFSQATPYSPDGPPVERKPANLTFKPNKANAERTLELDSKAIYTWNLLGKVSAEGYPLSAKLTEQTLQRVPPGILMQRNLRLPPGGSLTQLTYTDLTFDIPIDTGVPQADSAIRQLLRQFGSTVKGLVTYTAVTRDGVMKDATLNKRARTPGTAQTAIPQFNQQVMQSLTALSIPLPNKSVNYGDTWEYPTNLFIETRNRYEAALFKMQLKYVGVRDRGGRQEAVIEIEGHLSKDSSLKSIDADDLKKGDPMDDPPDGGGGNRLYRQARPYPPKAAATSKKGLYGLAKGYAFVDVVNGYVSEVKLFIDVDAEITVQDPDSKTNVPVMASGTMDLMLRRMGK